MLRSVALPFFQIIKITCIIMYNTVAASFPGYTHTNCEEPGTGLVMPEWTQRAQCYMYLTVVTSYFCELRPSRHEN